VPGIRFAATLTIALAAVALAGSCGAPSSTPPAPVTTSVTPTAPAPTPTVSIDRHAPAGFVDLSDVDPSILRDIRYYTDHNFVGRRIDGYLEPRCLLTLTAARALARVQTAALAKGYRLKMYDCYRPERAGEDFSRWAKSPGEQTTKPEFYPDLTKSDLFPDGYVGGAKTSHSRGSTVDLTLVPVPAPSQRPYVAGEPLTPCTAPQAQRFPDNSLDMGTGFDCFNSRSHTLDSRITGQPRTNRLLLKQLMSDAGFVNYANEWWHFQLSGEPYPDTYFDFPVAHAAVS
jgi:D-alanyl-D-alanine dipeptidase